MYILYLHHSYTWRVQSHKNNIHTYMYVCIFVHLGDAIIEEPIACISAVHITMTS